MNNVFVETFLKNGGVAVCDSTLEANKQGCSVLLGGIATDFKQNFANALEREEIFLLSPLCFNPFNFCQFVYEVGCEEAVVALLAYGLSQRLQQGALVEFAKTLDVGYLASECNFAEEELEAIVKSKKDLIFCIGSDLYAHKCAENIARILALLSQSLENFQIVFAESFTSTMLKDKQTIAPLEEIVNYDGLVVVLKENTNKCGILEASRQFCLVGKASEDTVLKVQLLELDKEIPVKLHCNENLKGLVGILWVAESYECFCYQRVKINKVA